MNLLRRIVAISVYDLTKRMLDRPGFFVVFKYDNDRLVNSKQRSTVMNHTYETRGWKKNTEKNMYIRIMKLVTFEVFLMFFHFFDLFLEETF